MIIIILLYREVMHSYWAKGWKFCDMEQALIFTCVHLLGDAETVELIKCRLTLLSIWLYPRYVGGIFLDKPQIGGDSGGLLKHEYLRLIKTKVKDERWAQSHI